MQWFNWILRGGKRETLPDYFLDAQWLRKLYPNRDDARRIVARLLHSGRLSEAQLRSLNARQLDEYVQSLVRDHAQRLAAENARAHAGSNLHQGACLGSVK